MAIGEQHFNMRVLKMLYELTKNPLLISNYAKYVSTSKFLKRNIIKEINGVKFEFNFNLNSRLINLMYFNIYELNLMKIMKDNLNKGDVFFDIGANVGYISAVGIGLIGKSGQVHSFEPVPQYALNLKKIKELNPEYSFFANNCACSDKKGFSKIDLSTSNIGWNTMVPNFMEKNDRNKSINVPMCRLDDYICKNNLNKITLIKIDTEGYELKVLKGLQGYFEDTQVADRPPIYCEIAPSAYPLLQLSLKSLSKYMERYSYYAFDSRDISKRIDISKLEKTTNVLFLCR